MADEITPVDSNEITGTRFIRTTDQVLGDPPGTTGTLAGPINVILQKIINTLLYLKNRVEGLNLTAPNASTTQRGIVELATLAEARAGTDTQRAVTPAGVAAAITEVSVDAATISTAGIVELATNAEARAGTDNTRAMTSRNVREAIDDRVPNATTSTRGKIEISSAAEADGLANDVTAMTPAKTLRAIEASDAVMSEDVTDMEQITQAEYDALTPNTNIVYFVVG